METIDCSDLLDISVVQTLYAQLRQSSRAASAIVLKAENLQRVDGAGLQLLVSFFREAQRLNLSISWQGTSPALRNAAQLLGVAQHLQLDTTTN